MNDVEHCPRGLLLVLAITQVIGWGTIGFPAVMGSEISNSLALSLTTIFSGTSIFFVTMGLCSIFLPKALTRVKVNKVMASGSALASISFIFFSVSNGPFTYFSSWTLLGIAGAATLSTPAYILLNNVAGKNAKKSISAIMLMTGLSNSIFWPLTSFLSHEIGWRNTCLVYAGLLAMVCIPLYLLTVFVKCKEGENDDQYIHHQSSYSTPRKSIFTLIALAISANAFVTFGFAAVLVELLKHEGIPAAKAVFFSSCLGIIQVTARSIDYVGGRSWDGLTTGVFSTLAILFALLLLLVGNGISWTIVAFIFIYGLGSGAFAVSRATIPLVFFDKEEFSKALSHIALPINLISAVAPPILVNILTNSGSKNVIILSLAFSSFSLFVLLLLNRQKRIE
ncbi:MFS transporter [Acerihabitans sp. TG2]|uniref:MFS transporter n=1 Tax=Acerihabitans sp. TG2 TaxID=3096008 RepID=UPI002B22608C|nr:MFS transporter [Acerihabitans sp. TG2]MEA9389785.1 MFS transporter [Acerihabitans sp. TG2]